MTLINREDAIDELRRLIPYKKYHRGEWVYLLDKKEVFKALSALPTVSATKKLNNQIHLCDSCISNYPNCPAENKDVLFGNGVGNANICCCAKYLVSVDRPQGEWINRENCQVDEDAYEVATCSNCKSEITIEYPHDNFCPNCGAKMGGDTK